MKKIYIAGKVTGLPVQEREDKFNRASLEVSRAGYFPVNPLDLVKDPNTAWEPAMRTCIKALMDVDAVLLLPCNEQSRGASLEKQLAGYLNIPIYTSVKSLSKKLKV